MTAHVRYPGLDDTGTPATLSQPILVGLLRHSLGFQGVVTSDSLLMEGVKSQCQSAGELAIRTLLAGVDLLLDVDDPLETLSALEAAVAEGQIPVARVEQAYQRVANLRQQLLAHEQPPTSIPLIRQQADALSRYVARGAIQQVACRQPLLPFSPSKSTAAFLLRPHQSHLDPPEQPLGAALREKFTDCHYCELGPQSTPDDYAAALTRARDAEQVVIAQVVKPAAWHRFGLLPEQDAWLQQLTESRGCVLASLGTPEALEQYPAAGVRICAYSDVPGSQHALAEWLITSQNPQPTA